MDIGAPELIIVLLIVVLLFGPGRLAGLGGEIGRSIREFREGLQGDREKTDSANEETGEATPIVQTKTESGEIDKDQTDTES